MSLLKDKRRDSEQDNKDDIQQVLQILISSCKMTTTAISAYVWRPVCLLLDFLLVFFSVSYVCRSCSRFTQRRHNYFAGTLACRPLFSSFLLSFFLTGQYMSHFLVFSTTQRDMVGTLGGGGSLKGQEVLLKCWYFCFDGR